MNPYLVLLYGQHECWSYVHCTHWPECMYVRVRLSPVTPVNSSYDLPLDLPSSFHAPGQSCLAVKPSNNGSTAGAEVWNHLRQSVWSATTACQLKWKLSCTSNKLSDSCPELLTSDSYFNLYFHFVTLVMLDQSSLCRLGTKYFVDVGSGCVLRVQVLKWPGAVSLVISVSVCVMLSASVVTSRGFVMFQCG